MSINTSLRFLAIAGAFLSAEAVLAKNSFSTAREIVLNNTFSTQSSGLHRVDQTERLNLPETQIDQVIDKDNKDRLITKYRQPSNSTEQNLPIDIVARSTPESVQQNLVPTDQTSQFGSDDDQGEALATRSRSNHRSMAKQPAQINVFGHVFASDLANINPRPLISSVPNQVEQEQTPQSVEIPVPSPRTQQIPGRPSLAKPIRPNPGSNIESSTVQGSVILTPIAKPTVPSDRVSDSSSAESIYPLTIPAPITSRFGWRTHPITGIRRFHAGIDFGAPAGTPVVATMSGTVISAGWNGGYGKAIVIQQNNQQVLYGHLSEISVQPGQSITQGTAIGLVGSTGNSTGPHLHFESRVANAETWTAIDPSVEIHYALDNLRRSMPFAQRDSSPGL